MKKVTLSFPNYDSLWLFKEKSKAINVSIEPRKNLISGLFTTEEVEIALNQLKARLVETTSTNNIPRPIYTETKAIASKVRIRSRLYQLLALMHLLFVAGKLR